MRVIAGEAKRLKLVSPKGYETRPTGDKIKETLFNILAPHIWGVNFLDLFAGSGGIGIEALSRGAASCTFIEKDREAVKCIRQNLETTHFTERAEVKPYDVLTCIHALSPKGRYDIVFMDPPYRLNLEEPVLSILAVSDSLSDDALIICEAAADTDFSFVTGLGISVIRVKEYKNSKHVFMRKATADIIDTED